MIVDGLCELGLLLVAEEVVVDKQLSEPTFVMHRNYMQAETVSLCKDHLFKKAWIFTYKAKENPKILQGLV